MKNGHLIFCALLALVIYSCSKDEEEQPVSDPYIAILGKWELVKTNLGNEDKPSGFKEYLPDNVLRVYDYKEKEYYYYKYFFNDSIVTKELTYFDAIDGEPLTFQEPYEYKFSNRNILILNFQYPAIQTTFTYKRIE